MSDGVTFIAQTDRQNVYRHPPPCLDPSNSILFGSRVEYCLSLYNETASSRLLAFAVVPLAADNDTIRI
jgi:hypothetical protein